MKTNLEPILPVVKARIHITDITIPVFQPLGRINTATPIKLLYHTPDIGAPVDLHQMRCKLALAEAALVWAENKAREAEAADRSKSDLLADMSHEIRTPLGAIMGLSRILMATSLDDKQRQYLTVLQGCAEDLMAITNVSLEIDKIESRSNQPEQLPFSMPVLLQHIVAIMSVKAEEKGIVLELRCDHRPDEVCIGDSGRIQQIVMNLVGNALKFTETGRVIVAFAVDGKEEGGWQTSLSVIDNGIGIPPDKIDAIFKRFVQADVSIAHKFGGSGLGLSISQALAKSMGGEITVSSTVGKGSTFVLHLPLLAGTSI